MNRRDVTSIMGRLNLEPVLIADGRMDQFFADVAQLGETPMSREEERAYMASRSVEMLGSYGLGCSDASEKPFTFANGVAFIPIHGALINRLSSYWGYVTGYNFIRAQFNAALDDPDVKLIVFDVNSYGGEAAGCFELSREIAVGAKQKRTLAVVNSNVYSAAYALASACSAIYVTPSGGAGSIGVLVAHVDYSGLYTQMGIKVTMISAPKGGHKTDGNPYEALPEAVQARIQENIDKSYSAFVELVADNRGIDSQAVIDTQAQTLRPDEALDAALIDAIETPTQAVARFLAELGVDSPADLDDEEDETMTVATAEQIAAYKASPEYLAELASAKAEGAKEGATATATRYNAVMSAESGEGDAKVSLSATRPALTKTLLATSLSADEIVSALKAAAPEQAAATPESTTENAGTRDTLTPAMSATGGGAGVKPESGQDAGKPSRAAAALGMAGRASAAAIPTSGIPRVKRN